MVQFLLQLEWMKIRPQKTYTVSTILYLVMLPLLVLAFMNGGINFGPAQGIMDTLYSFPRVWQTVAYFGSWLTFFFLPFMGIQLVTSEYAQKTMRQNIISGMERQDWLLGKVLTILAISLGAALYAALVAVMIGLLSGGGLNSFASGSEYVFRFFLQNLTYMSLGLFLAVLLRRTGLAFFIFFPYVMFIERIIRYLVFNKIGISKAGLFMPANIGVDLLPFPGIDDLKNLAQNNDIELYLTGTEAMIGSVVYIVLFLFLSFRIFQKQDI